MTGRGEVPRDGVPDAEPLPPHTAAVFGGAFSQAVRYVGLLVTDGVERGLLGPREADRIWTRHVLNSVALSSLVPPQADVVDVGSGAGLPGIPLVLARPDLRMTLLEPMARRAAFLHEVVAELGLDVTVVRGRAEDLARGSADVVVARAVAPLARLASWTLPLLRPRGRLLALKGSSATTEIAEAASTLKAWPTARVSLVDAPVGSESSHGTATVVMVDLDASSTRAEDR